MSRISLTRRISRLESQYPDLRRRMRVNYPGDNSIRLGTRTNWPTL